MNVSIRQLGGVLKGVLESVPLAGLVTIGASKLSQYTDQFLNLPQVKEVSERIYGVVGRGGDYDPYEWLEGLKFCAAWGVVTCVVRGFQNPDRPLPDWLRFSIHHSM